MTSRERVLAAIKHEQPDKVPVDIGSNPSSGISAIAYGNLLRYSGKEHLPILIYDVVQQLAQPDDEVLHLLGADVVDLGRTFNTSASDWHETILLDGQKAFYPKWFNPVKQSDGSWNAPDRDDEIIAKMPSTGTFFDTTIYPWESGYPDSMESLNQAMGKSMWSAFVHSPWDNANMKDFWEVLQLRAIKLRESSDKAIMLSVGCNLFEWGTFIRRMDNFLMDLYLEKKNVHALLDGLVERHMQTLEKACYYLGDVVDIIRFGDDLGMSNGPFMSNDTYREMFKNRHKLMTDYVKKNSSMKIFLHSCGSIYNLIPDLIDAGFEILNPVQTNCRDMEPWKLKREFGNDITFWGGGVETVGVLNDLSPDDVRRQVLERLEIFSLNGGYIFNPIHNILPDVPPENIIAAYNAVKEFNSSSNKL
ncbi:MAG: methyltransferase [Bacteroidales bacterium]|nr:methyltransferase [Bacteroidales bacterium]